MIEMQFNKNKIEKIFFVTFLCLLYLIAVPCLSLAQHNYTEIQPPEPDWSLSQTYAINNNGTTIGYGLDSTGYKGLIYNNGTFTKLLPHSMSNAWACGINDLGDVVGYTSGVGISNYRGFIYSNGSYTELLPQGWREAYTCGINNNKTVVGYGREKKTYKGFLYSNGNYTELLPPGWQEAYVYNINNNGVAVGGGNDRTGLRKGFIYSNGNYIELLPPGWQRANAHDINDRGTVVGYGQDANRNIKGFIYSNGSYTELLPPGWRWAEANGINNSGVVVGRGGYYGLKILRGFLYNNGSYYTLLPSGWNWAQAYDINDKWVITGYGSYGNGNRGFIATGVPHITVTPVTIYLGGNINVGIISDIVSIKNDGAGDLIIGSVTSPSPPFAILTDNCSGQTLLPLATCTITYRFLPVPTAKFISESEIFSNDPDENPVKITLVVFPDNDGDGYTFDVDCDDNNTTVNPGAVEIPNNGRDDDCNPATPDVSPAGR